MTLPVSRPFFVYMLASARNGTLYIGHTDNLGHRVWTHKQRALPGFTAKYGVGMLVWYEPHETRDAAFRRERQLKKWNRTWKMRLIEDSNPGWSDLFDSLRM